MVDVLRAAIALRVTTTSSRWGWRSGGALGRPETTSAMRSHAAIEHHRPIRIRIECAQGTLLQRLQLFGSGVLSDLQIPFSPTLVRREVADGDPLLCCGS